MKEGAAPTGDPPRFVCDASLGGLARWLRAAGYEALWRPEGAPEDLVREAHEQGLVLLTSKGRIFERNLVRTGAVRALHVPSFKGRVEQLEQVMRLLDLEPRESRCMACGARLSQVSKEEVLSRIPPRTARWRDEYFACDGCGKLFWEGTHWEKIRSRLAGTGPR